MTLVYRSRSLPITRKGARRVDGTYNSFTKKWTYGVTYDDLNTVIPGITSGSQVTGSEGHPFRTKKNRPSGDVGGPFYSRKVEMVAIPAPVSNYTIFNGGQFDQQVTNATYWPIDPRTVSFPNAQASSNAALDAYGTTAIARCSPTNSIADAATFLGELVKDGLPSIPGMRTWEAKIRTLANVGDEFLNHVFGWLPLLHDVRKHAEAIRRADAVLTQYERDAGKMVRRRYYFPTENSTSRTVLDTNRSVYQVGHSSLHQNDYGIGNVVLTSETVKKRWFSGAFTYHLPAGYDAREGLKRYALEAKKVFGVNVTPETLWNLAPWSWAIDWFSDAGDVIHNLSSWKTYGLVLRYGYIMEEISIKNTYTHEPVSYPNLFNRPLVCDPLVVTCTVKSRRPATPFGFGVNLNGLSAIQTAIIGALGLSRSH